MLEVEYFKKLLEERKKQIEKNIKETASELEELKNMEVNDDGDYAALCTDNMIDQAINEQQYEELKEIEASFKKIKEGTYGTCEMCGEPIRILRLKVKPHAKYCIVCREIVEKEPKK
ncbi:RNA polymerase-binding protein DksA [Nitrosophilus alvini]|uniref:RNA polymerase-binding protein DksA n=1 Tax=Nitrosophilus alvini TaxID=2714855 RepID=UPI001F1FD64B|nr:RNA polymerase-binding protein DksA [Nitrosophilus alvini]